METRVRQKKILGRQDKIENVGETGEMEPTTLRHAIVEGEISLGKILEELKEFRKKNKQDLNSTNKRIEEGSYRGGQGTNTTDGRGTAKTSGSARG